MPDIDSFFRYIAEIGVMIGFRRAECWLWSGSNPREDYSPSLQWNTNKLEKDTKNLSITKYTPMLKIILLKMDYNRIQNKKMVLNNRPNLI